MRSDSQFYSHCLEVLKRAPLFSNFDDKMFQDIMPFFKRETWVKNSPAMDSGQTLHRFYVLISGRLNVSQINPDTSREQTLFLLGPGDVFDIICLLDNEEHDISATALDDLETLSVPITEVRNWVEQNPKFNRTLLSYLGKQIRDLERVASDISLYDTGTRLAKLILRFVDHNHPERGLKLINNLSHEELAKLIGTVRVVINRHIQNFKREGILIIQRRNMVVKNLRGLLNKVEKSL